MLLSTTNKYDLTKDVRENVGEPEKVEALVSHPEAKSHLGLVTRSSYVPFSHDDE